MKGKQGKEKTPFHRINNGRRVCCVSADRKCLVNVEAKQVLPSCRVRRETTEVAVPRGEPATALSAA